MAEQTDQEIVVKKIKIYDNTHHGGAWKVAYADFVTAMMAFFLLLWLLNATTEEQKDGISNYFEPIGAVKGSSGSDGMFGGISVSDPGPIPKPGAKESLNLEDPTEEDQDADAKGEGEDIEEIAASQTEIDPSNEERMFNTSKRLLESALDDLPPELQDLKESIKVDITEDGLRIQIIDQQRRPMFLPQSAELTPLAKQILSFVASIAGRLPNKISVTGHTDSTPFIRQDGTGKWELSIHRAQTARRTLLNAGIDGGRFKTVYGRADSELAFPQDPRAPANRRLVVVLLRSSPEVAASETPVPPPIAE